MPCSFPQGFPFGVLLKNLAILYLIFHASFRIRVSFFYFIACILISVIFNNSKILQKEGVRYGEFFFRNVFKWRVG